MVFNRSLSSSFIDGTNYQKARRDHPPRLIEDIIQITHLTSRANTLDVGCGTGKSTFPFAQRGFSIMGIDPSKEMLTVAQENSKALSNICYLQGKFEEIILPEKSFDIITFGQSIHWIEPEKVYQRAHTLLKKEGHIVIYFSLYNWRLSPLLKKIEKIFFQECESFPYDLDNTKEKTIQHLEKSNLFKKRFIKKYKEQDTLTKNQLISLISSFSWVSSLSEEKKKEVFLKIDKINEGHQEPIQIQSEYTLIIAHQKN